MAEENGAAQCELDEKKVVAMVEAIIQEAEEYRSLGLTVSAARADARAWYVYLHLGQDRELVAGHSLWETLDDWCESRSSDLDWKVRAAAGQLARRRQLRQEGAS